MSQTKVKVVLLKLHEAKKLSDFVEYLEMLHLSLPLPNGAEAPLIRLSYTNDVVQEPVLMLTYTRKSSFFEKTKKKFARFFSGLKNLG